MLSVLLVEMDGVYSDMASTPVFILATTCDKDELDPAILRPGCVNICDYDRLNVFELSCFASSLVCTPVPFYLPPGTQVFTPLCHFSSVVVTSAHAQYTDPSGENVGTGTGPRRY